jgi:hypothetical protein
LSRLSFLFLSFLPFITISFVSTKHRQRRLESPSNNVFHLGNSNTNTVIDSRKESLVTSSSSRVTIKSSQPLTRRSESSVPSTLATRLTGFRDTLLWESSELLSYFLLFFLLFYFFPFDPKVSKKDREEDKSHEFVGEWILMLIFTLLRKNEKKA